MLSPSVASADGGSRIAFTRTNADFEDLSLWTARPDGSGQRRIADGVGSFPDWSPDRQRLLFDYTDEDGNQQLATVRPDGSRFRQLTDVPGISEAGDYSPDGRTIVFDRSTQSPDDPAFHTSLWTMRSDGSRARPLFGPSSTTFDVEPAYSPDGSKIAFARLSLEPTFTAAIYIADADGTDVRRITPYRHVIEHPKWSPDGRRIIFNIANPENLDDPLEGIWEVRASGGPARHLLPATKGLHGFKPDYSPDGQRILFGCFVRAQQQDDLCTMTPTGHNVRRITQTPNHNENNPAWR
ncbi:TolB family protein [Kribbella sp. NPDC056951]|uniref:TolB family protein n=1 Tax=Kribbella sp. NPDC056951 TaxID=3345978 RepID=UPI0036337AA3